MRLEPFSVWKPRRMVVIASLLGKAPLRQLMGKQMRLPDPVWKRLDLAWCAFFALISLLLAISLGAWYQLYRAFEQPPQASRFAWEMASAINLARTPVVLPFPTMA